MTHGERRRYALRTGAVVLIVAAGAVTGWLLGGGEKRAQASVPVQFVGATENQAYPFTDATDVNGKLTVKGSGPFGGTGSNLVCDREKLIGFLVAKPDRLRAWARALRIEPTAEAVTKYIRSLRPVTLVSPTRVTNHSYENGRAVDFQAILGAGTAVLVDDRGAIRVRCRCGNPLLDPVVSTDERCISCPKDYTLPTAWQMAPVHYVVHPSPPPIAGERASNADVKTVRVVRMLQPSYVLEETTVDDDGTTRTQMATVPKEQIKTVTEEKVRTVKRTETVTAPGRTVTVASPPVTVASPPVTVPGPARTTTVTAPPRTVTVIRQVPVPGPTRTVTVYVGEG